VVQVAPFRAASLSDRLSLPGRLAGHQVAQPWVLGGWSIQHGDELLPCGGIKLEDGKRVLASPREVQEVRNALLDYEGSTGWMPRSEEDLLEAHLTLMAALVDAPGRYRAGGVGVMAGGLLVHIAPPAHRVPGLMADLLAWLDRAEDHRLISSSVFHYEFGWLRSSSFVTPAPKLQLRVVRCWQPVPTIREAGASAPAQ
jgi:hypothetical protein